MKTKRSFFSTVAAALFVIVFSVDATAETIIRDQNDADPNNGADDGQLPDLSVATTGFGDREISETGLEALAAGANIIIEDIGISLQSLVTDGLLDLQTDASGSVTIDGDFGNDLIGDFNMDANDTISTQGGDVTFTGPATIGNLTTNGGTLTFGDNVTLAGASTTFDTGVSGGNITFALGLIGASAFSNDLTLTAGAGDIQFNGPFGFGGAELGIINILSAHQVSMAAVNANGLLTPNATGDMILNGDVTTVGNAGISLQGDTVALGDGVDLVSSGQSIALVADTLTDGATSTINAGGGIVTLAPLEATNTISVCNLDAANGCTALPPATATEYDLASYAITAGNLQIGQSAQTGGIGVAAVTLGAGQTYDVLLQNGGTASIDIWGDFNGNALMLDSGSGGISLAANVTTSGDDVIFSDDVTLFVDAVINTGAGGDVDVGNIIADDGSQGLTIAAGTGTVSLADVGQGGAANALMSLDVTGGTINLSGDIDTVAAAGIVLHGTKLLSTDVTLTTTNDDVDLSSGAVESDNGTQGLTIAAGAGTVSLADVGQASALKDLDVTGGTINLGGNLSTAGAISLAGTKSFTNDITLESNSFIDLGNGSVVGASDTRLAVIADGAIDIDSEVEKLAFTNIGIGDVTVNEFDALTVEGSIISGGGIWITAGGVLTVGPGGLTTPNDITLVGTCVEVLGSIEAGGSLFVSQTDGICDGDGDGVLNENDNCPTVSNATQANQDGDAAGDACDAYPTNSSEIFDTDGDGIGDNWENDNGLDRLDGSDANADPDVDTLSNLGEFLAGTDPQDPDTDGDSILDGVDNCALLSNFDQIDQDGDGIGDLCELSSLIPLPDINSDGIEDIAVLRRGSTLAEIRSGTNGVLQKNITFFDDNFTPISAVALPDSDGNGVAELGLLASRNSDGRIVVQIRNITGVEAPRFVWFAANHAAVGITVVDDDADNNGVVELAVLSHRNSDSRGLVEVKNAFGATNPNALWAGAGLTSSHVEVIGDKDANGVPEIAILSTRDSDGRIVAEIKNAAGATLPTAVWFAPGHTAIDMAAVDDKDNNGIPEVAVLSRRDSDGRIVAEIKNASGPTAPSTVWFAAGHTATAIRQVHDADGNGVPEVAVLSARDSDGRTLVEVKNAFGATNPNPVWYSAGFTARGLAILDDTDADAIEEALVLMIRDSDGRILVQGRNAAGNPAPNQYWFSP